MSDRRKHRRVNKRIQVEYGVTELDQRGVVGDISLGGMFIECRRPADLGTQLHIHVLDPGRDFYVEGIVARLKLVEPNLRRVASEGMGIRFLTPAELVMQSVPKAQRRAEAGEVFLAERDDAERLLAEQLAARMILAPAEDPPPALGVTVEFVVRLGFLEGEEFTGQGRLIQLLGADPTNKQAVIEVHDADDLRDWLRELL